MRKEEKSRSYDSGELSSRRPKSVSTGCIGIFNIAITINMHFLCGGLYMCVNVHDDVYVYDYYSIPYEHSGLCMGLSFVTGTTLMAYGLE